MTEEKDLLIERLRAIEYSFAGCTGIEATDVARGKLRAIAAELAAKETPVAFQFATRDFWSLRILLALLRRYGLKPYRYPRQRVTTVLVKTSPSFAREILVPEYRRFREVLQERFHEITERVVADVFGGDSGEVAIVTGAPPPAAATIED